MFAVLVGCSSTTPPGDAGGTDGGPADSGAGDAGCLLTSCGTSCVDIDTDVHHCGACDEDCTTLDGVRPDAATCEEGACVIDDACEPERGDCDGDAANGCEATLTTADHCGDCATACSGAAPVCSMDDAGSYACASGCTAETPDRCGEACVDTTTDVAHCGGCDVACEAPADATPTCAASTCDFVCDAGLHRCGDACVADTSVTSCGASCAPCPAPANATPTCDGTTCDFVCDAGFHRCGDACVANTSVTSCGASCTPCPAPANAAPTCDGTTCGFACNAGFHRCGDACVANTSVTSCGASCAPCPAPANASATCNGTGCGFECNAGFHACGASCAANNSTTACGPGCAVCPVPANGSAVCSWGACAINCNFGYMPVGDACVPIPTVVTLTSPNPTATEGAADTATFRIARTGILSAPLTVRLTIPTSSTVTVAAGVLPVDFDLTGASVARTGRSVSVVIPAGASSVNLIMTARVDAHAEVAETLRLDVVADASYELGTGTSATATIAGGGTNVIASGDSLTSYAVREGSLRLALENARAVPGATVNASIPGPIALVAGLPLLDFNVTINGPAPARLVIRGNGTFGIVETRATVRFNYLELRGGSTANGGAIFNRGNLTVDHCRLADNHATVAGSAIVSFLPGGTPNLLLRDSIIENNTGSPAVWLDNGTMSIGGTTFSGNAAGNVFGAYTNLGGNTPAAP